MRAVDLGYIRSEISQFQVWAGENSGTLVVMGLAVVLVIGFITVMIITTWLKRSQTRGVSRSRNRRARRAGSSS